MGCEKNTRRLRKNTRGEKKIRGAKKKYASTKTKIRVQIILVQMEQHMEQPIASLSTSREFEKKRSNFSTHASRLGSRDSRIRRVLGSRLQSRFRCNLSGSVIIITVVILSSFRAGVSRLCCSICTSIICTRIFVFVDAYFFFTPRIFSQPPRIFFPVTRRARFMLVGPYIGLINTR
jgi:hypothetical protein